MAKKIVKKVAKKTTAKTKKTTTPTKRTTKASTTKTATSKTAVTKRTPTKRTVKASTKNQRRFTLTEINALTQVRAFELYQSRTNTDGNENSDWQRAQEQICIEFGIDLNTVLNKNFK